jgi:septal ring factor EnvC (AmiA/AmiB activator)
MARRQNALALAHTGTVLRDLVPELRNRAHALSRELAGLAALRARLASDRAALDATLATLEIERAEIDRLLAKKAEDGKRLAGLVQAESKRVDELAARARSIEDLLAAVEKAKREREVAEAAEAARRAAELAAAETAASRPGQEAVVEEPATPLATPRPAVMARFTSLKGKLPWPAAGEITTRFGDRQANGLTARGFRIATRPSARVTAPSAGDVVFAAPFSGYGQLLILSQGDGYHLLLAGMERIDVTVGQKVLAGEPVGQMEGAGQGTRPVLYVELRHNGEPVDLTPWLVPGATKVSG